MKTLVLVLVVVAALSGYKLRSMEAYVACVDAKVLHPYACPASCITLL